ncbi:hypothetical protein [Microbacterium sp. NC79]|uniref:hypothetical protein n=1 Tax=Microbacterium sp. NC79 TaxID=2851009 RepID=UPI001C2BAB99|nr:hypothetical protein [Microbacterium sp. NC79]MBV0894493.1 hypothetical protein [Microbacterium sp. NC79]
MEQSAFPLLHSGRGDRNLRLSGKPGLTRVRHGIYTPTTEWLALTPWEQYAERVRAFRITHPNDVLSHESAIVAHGLPLFGSPSKIHVWDRERTKSVLVGDVMRHALADPRALTLTPFGFATSVIDTAIDFGRVRNRAHSLAVWDAALRGGADPAALRRRWRLQRNSRGTRSLAWLSEHTCALSESPGESVSRALIEWLGFPAPELQHPMETPEGSWRLDFWWAKQRVCGEFDGYDKYSQHEAGPAGALRHEKRREDALRRAGAVVARWEFRDLTTPARLDRILRAAGMVPIAPQNQTMLQAYRRSVAATGG